MHCLRIEDFYDGAGADRNSEELRRISIKIHPFIGPCNAALDMRGNSVTQAFIRGKEIVLDDVQKQLYRKYEAKYGIK